MLTGSYDHTVKIWDLRSESSVLTVDHGSPVECVRLFPTGGLCVSAGELLYFFSSDDLSLFVCFSLFHCLLINAICTPGVVYSGVKR